MREPVSEVRPKADRQASERSRSGGNCLKTSRSRCIAHAHKRAKRSGETNNPIRDFLSMKVRVSMERRDSDRSHQEHTESSKRKSDKPVSARKHKHSHLDEGELQRTPESEQVSRPGDSRASRKAGET
jgi:hypothetical protein